MSLFGDRRLVEVRFSGKAGKEGSATLARLAQTADDETLLLVITPRLDGATQATAWVKAIEARGVFLPIYEIGARQLEGWLEARCRRAGLEPTADALALLAATMSFNVDFCRATSAIPHRLSIAANRHPPIPAPP